jgi:hypothetical protein
MTQPRRWGQHTGGTIAGALTKSFTPPFNGNAPLHLFDPAGDN